MRISMAMDLGMIKGDMAKNIITITMDLLTLLVRYFLHAVNNSPPFGNSLESS